MSSMTRNRIYQTKYETDEERYEAKKASMRKYANARYICDKCNKEVSKGDKIKHNKTKKHLKNVENYENMLKIH